VQQWAVSARGHMMLCKPLSSPQHSINRTIYLTQGAGHSVSLPSPATCQPEDRSVQSVGDKPIRMGWLWASQNHLPRTASAIRKTTANPLACCEIRPSEFRQTLNITKKIGKSRRSVEHRHSLSQKAQITQRLPIRKSTCGS
jgi:hypothetical protein